MKTGKYLLFLIPVLLAAGGHAQGIKKIGIGELETYIQQSHHPLVVNFWATFCQPCVAEIPYFQEEVKKTPDVELLLVSLDLPDYYPGRIERFAKAHGFSAPIAWLNETNADYFCPKIDKEWSGGIPSTLLINNRTGFRRFYERQLTGAQFRQSLLELTGK